MLTPAIATAQGEKLPGNTGRMREAMDELLRAFLIDFAAEDPK